MIMKTADIEYSEAFAGSGEFTAVMLVCSVLSAKDKSLILLDEPEVSLHPAAQRQVVDFLSAAAQQRHHQIVFATHSTEMVRDLPVNAIKVLSIRADNGRVDIPSQQVAPHAAFEAVGAQYDHPAIVVEDRLAEAFVRHAIKSLPIADSVKVRFIPGGANTLWSHYIPMWAHDERDNLMLLLDGDQWTEEPPRSSQVAPDNLETTVSKYLCHNAPKLPFGAGESESDTHRRISLGKVLDWRCSYVGFLPMWTPEEYLLRTRGERINEPLPFGPLLDEKLQWRKIADHEFGHSASGEQIFALQQIELNKLPQDDPALFLIADAVQKFVERTKP